MGFNDINIKVSGGSDIISTLQTYTTKILKPNVVDGKNVLTQEMLSSKNTKYVIKYVYELLGDTLTMPQNVILEFDGGSIKNGTLVGNDTLMLNTNETESILDNVTLDGTWKESSYDLVEEVVADKAPGDGMGRIILRKDKTFAEQLTQENTIYVIRYDFDLTKDVTIPANCVLQFEGGSLSGEHTITGSNTGIKAELNKIFDVNITLEGSWNIVEAYTSWIDYSGDVSIALNMLSKISKKIVIDKDCVLKHKALLQEKDVEIDGNGHTVTVYVDDSIVGASKNVSAISLLGNKIINIHDVNFVYDVRSVPRRDTSDTVITYYLIDIMCNDDSGTKIEINNITISDFDTRVQHTYWCNWAGIFVAHFDQSSKADIHNIKVNNSVVACKTGDRVTDIAGRNYPIFVQTKRNTSISGQLHIYNISLDTIANYVYGTEDDLKVIMETAGIYISGTDEQDNPYTRWIADIHNISFKDVSRRCLKIQGHGASVKNFSNIITEENNTPKVYLEYMVDFQGRDNIVDNASGDVLGYFCKNKGGNLSVSNCSFVFKEPTYARLIEMATGTNAIISNCIIKGTDNQDNVNEELISINGLNDEDTSVNIDNVVALKGYNQRPSHLIHYNNNVSTLTDKNVYINIRNCFLQVSYLGTFDLIPTYINICDSVLEFNSFVRIGSSITNLSIKNTTLNIVNADTSYELFGRYNNVINYKNVRVLCSPTKNVYDTLRDNVDIVVEGLNIEDCEDVTIRVPSKRCLISELNVTALYLKIYKNAGDVTIKDTSITTFEILDASTDSLQLKWYNNTLEPRAVPYIVEVGKLYTLTDISIFGKVGTPYLYNGKIVFYNGTNWVDATGATV